MWYNCLVEHILITFSYKKIEIYTHCMAQYTNIITALFIKYEF